MLPEHKTSEVRQEVSSHTAKSTAKTRRVHKYEQPKSIQKSNQIEKKNLVLDLVLTVVVVHVSDAVPELMVGPPADLVVLGNRHRGVEGEIAPAGLLVGRQEVRPVMLSRQAPSRRGGVAAAALPLPLAVAVVVVVML